jgi:hypothetical protein
MEAGDKLAFQIGMTFLLVASTLRYCAAPGHCEVPDALDFFFWNQIMPIWRDWWGAIVLSPFVIAFLYGAHIWYPRETARLLRLEAERKAAREAARQVSYRLLDRVDMRLSLYPPDVEDLRYL